MSDVEIAVCLKWVPDVKVWIDLDPVGSRPDPYDLVYEMNPNDRVALWEGLRLRENLGGRLTLLSFGPQGVDFMLRRGLALGADRAVRVVREDRAPLGQDITTDGLYEALNSLRMTLILCGEESADGMRGETGPALAARLGYDLVASVMEIKAVDPANRRVVVQKALGGGWGQTLECPLPAVLSFVAWNVSPFSPSILDFEPDINRSLQSLDQAIELFLPTSTHQEGPALGDIGPRESWQAASRRPEVLPAPDPQVPAAQRIKTIYASREREQSRGVMLEGSPEEVAVRLVDVLTRQGFAYPQDD